MNRITALLSTLAVAVAGLAFTPAAHADELQGNCYQMSVTDLNATVFPTDPKTVPCAGRHNTELWKTGRIPADVNARDWAADACSWDNVNAYYGATRFKNGVAKNPLRLGSFFWQDGHTYQCGATVVRYNGTKPTSADTLTKPLKTMLANNRASLQVCLSSASGRKPTRNPLTVPCPPRGNWHRDYIVKLDELGTRWPGTKAITEYLVYKCKGVQWVGYPLKKQWTTTGTNYGMCYSK